MLFPAACRATVVQAILEFCSPITLFSRIDSAIAAPDINNGGLRKHFEIGHPASMKAGEKESDDDECQKAETDIREEGS